MRLIALILVFACATVGAGQSVPKPAPKAAPPPQPLLQRLLRIAGLTAAPTQMRAPGDATPAGDVWIVGADGRGARGLTSDGGNRSPIFTLDGSLLLVLRGATLIRLNAATGAATPGPAARGVAKLVGVDPGSPDEVVVLLDAPASGSPVATLSLQSGTLTPLPFDTAGEDERRMLAQIRAQSRTYGDISVYTREQTRRGLTGQIDWIDVFLARPGAAPVNVSACDGVDCAQPALSPDGRRVAFIKSAE